MANKARKSIESYAHDDKQRANIPPVGLVTPRTDPEQGKAERTSLSLPVDIGKNQRVAVKIVDDRGGDVIPMKVK